MPETPRPDYPANLSRILLHLRGTGMIAGRKVQGHLTRFHPALEIPGRRLYFVVCPRNGARNPEPDDKRPECCHRGRNVKKFGIRITLPPGNPLRAPHLLGADWESYRWFDTKAERDAAYAGMLQPLQYYRAGDTASQVLEKVER